MNSGGPGLKPHLWPPCGLGSSGLWPLHSLYTQPPDSQAQPCLGHPRQLVGAAAAPQGCERCSGQDSRSKAGPEMLRSGFLL